MAPDVRIKETPVGPAVCPPDPVETTVLYLYGDRHVTGAPESALDLAGHLASRIGATVVCPHYRPVFPAALQDVQAAYDHCRTRGPVVVAGEWLGAGLAAALLVRLRDSGAAPPRCAMFLSAMLDLTMEAPSLALNAAADPAFDAAGLRRRVARYAAGTARTDPFLSPLYANLHGLPPTQLLVAGTDPVLDDSLAFAARASRSGVTVDLRVRPDAAGLHAEAVPAMAGFIGTWAPRTDGASRTIPG